MPDLSNFQFAAPGWLALLALLPLLVLLRGRQGGSPAVRYSSTSVIKNLGKKRRSQPGSLGRFLFLLGLALLIIAMARPRAGGAYTVQNSSGVDIMLVVDVSGSMLAEDFETEGRRANRLEAVKVVTEKFINKRVADRLGMIGFAGKPFVVSPLTLTHNWLIQRLYKLEVGLLKEDGTAIGSAIAAAANRLKDHEAKSKIIVLLTDGSNNAGMIDPITAAEAAAALGIKIYTIGAGREGPVPMPVNDVFGRRVLRMVEVGFDEKALQEIAEIGNGRYFRATGTESLEDIYEEIDELEKTEYRLEQYVQYEDLYPYALLSGLLLTSLPILLQNTLWRRLP
jgi:Ca-activated chloride channel family protein